MDLKLIEDSSFGPTLVGLEEAAEQPGNRQKYADTCALKSLASTLPIASGLSLLISSAFGSLAGVILIVLGLVLAWTFWPGKERNRRRVLAWAGPQSRAFLEAHWDRRERLLENAHAYNQTLAGLRTLSSGDDAELQQGLAESMQQRLTALTEETDAYLREFEAATAEDCQRFRALEMEWEAAHRKALALPPSDKALKDFRKRVDELETLEAALDRLQSAAQAGITVDLTPFVAARRFRQELEEEREALVARGLKPKKLPAMRLGPKFLPASI